MRGGVARNGSLDFFESVCPKSAFFNYVWSTVQTLIL